MLVGPMDGRACRGEGEGFDYDGLSPEEREKIEAVAMDMWAPFIQATLAKEPGAEAKTVFNRLPVGGNRGKAVDTVPKREHRNLLEPGDETLKGSKYLRLYRRENVPRSPRLEFAELKRGGLKVSRAGAIKELLRDLWSDVYPEATRKFWKRWYFWATHSRLKPVLGAAGTIRRHIANNPTYFEPRVTNPLRESLNSRIRTTKPRAWVFGTSSTSIQQFACTAGGSIYTHAKPGSPKV